MLGAVKKGKKNNTPKMSVMKKLPEILTFHTNNNLCTRMKAIFTYFNSSV